MRSHADQLWSRLLTVFVLVCATPGAAQLAQDVIVLAVGSDDCCEDECDEAAERGERCPGTCSHCACCAHVNALTTPTARLLPAGQRVIEPAFGWYSERLCTSGYRAPPFRPPAA